ncbi:MAG: gamma carbonic anhydrase family protein [Gemmatimonadaceae bacterium]
MANAFAFDGFVPVIHESAFVHPNATVTGNVVIGRDVYAHIGHGAVVHGARIGENVLIGMNAVVMDNAVVGTGSIVGALCFVPSEMQIPPRSVVVGNPAKVVKQVSDEMLAWKTGGTALYQALPARLRESLRPSEPLREMPADRARRRMSYRTWKETRT